MAELVESGKTSNGVTIGQNTFGNYGIFADEKMVIQLSIIELVGLRDSITQELVELRDNLINDSQ